MKIKGLVWLDEIVEKVIQKHNVQPGEVKEVFDNGPQFRFVEKATVPRRMYMEQWARLKADDFLLSFLCIKKMETGLFYRPEI